MKLIQKTNLPSEIKHDFVMFCFNFPLTDKQFNTLVKHIKSKQAIISYLHRHVMRIACKVGVPKVLINESYDLKEMINNRFVTYKDLYHAKLNNNSRLIMKSVYQMEKYNNSRLNKIKALQEKIELNKLECDKDV